MREFVEVTTGGLNFYMAKKTGVQIRNEVEEAMTNLFKVHSEESIRKGFRDRDEHVERALEDLGRTARQGCQHYEEGYRYVWIGFEIATNSPYAGQEFKGVI